MQEYQIESEEAALEHTENLTEQAWSEIDSLTVKELFITDTFFPCFYITSWEPEAAASNG